MTNMIILQPNVPASIAASSVSPNFPAARLLDPQPKVVFKAAAAGTVNIDIDYGAAVSIDTVFLGFTDAGAADTWTITGGTTGYTTTTLKTSGLMRATGAPGPRYHAFWTGSAVNLRYLRISATTAAALTAGIVMAGQAFKPTWNREWGGGRGVLDLSTKTRGRGGEMWSDAQAKVPVFKWTFGDITDAELLQLWQIVLSSGESEPVLVCEDPDAAVAGLQERTHYGAFANLQEYSRDDANKTRWELKMEEWL